MVSALSDRVLLRDITHDDAPHILRLNADPEVLRHVHDAPFTDLDAARAWIAGIGNELPLGIGRWSIVTEDGTWIGRCSLRRQQDGEVLMGYRLLRQHWGKGYASNAVRLMLDQAFNVHHLPYVASKVAPENLASIRVIEKNGGTCWMVDPSMHLGHALVYRFERP